MITTDLKPWSAWNSGTGVEVHGIESHLLPRLSCCGSGPEVIGELNVNS